MNEQTSRKDGMTMESDEDQFLKKNEQQRRQQLDYVSNKDNQYEYCCERFRVSYERDMGFKTKMDPLLDFKVHNFCKYAHLDNHVDFKEKDKLEPDTGQFTEKKKEMRK